MIPGRSAEKATKIVLKAFRQKYLCIMFHPHVSVKLTKSKAKEGGGGGARPLGTISNPDL